MVERIEQAGLQIDKQLADFVANEAVQGIDISAADFWQALAAIMAAHVPTNRALLKKRDDLQARIDAYHKERQGTPHDAAAYKAFLLEIGYLVPEGADFTIETANVDDEIAHIAGPQLVVPIKNARFAVNAANARWGSAGKYDVFCDAISNVSYAEWLYLIMITAISALAVLPSESVAVMVSA